jgi:hypothetical protein
MRNYLLLNFILALGRGEDLFSSSPYNTLWRSISTLASNSGLTRPIAFIAEFWLPTVPVDDQQARSTYSKRCFGILVAGYAIAAEMAERDKAVEAENQLAFTEKDIVEDILKALT